MQCRKSRSGRDARLPRARRREHLMSNSSCNRRVAPDAPRARASFRDSRQEKASSRGLSFSDNGPTDVVLSMTSAKSASQAPIATRQIAFDHREPAHEWAGHLVNPAPHAAHGVSLICRALGEGVPRGCGRRKGFRRQRSPPNHQIAKSPNRQITKSPNLSFRSTSQFAIRHFTNHAIVFPRHFQMRYNPREPEPRRSRSLA